MSFKLLPEDTEGFKLLPEEDSEQNIVSQKINAFAKGALNRLKSEVGAGLLPEQTQETLSKGRLLVSPEEFNKNLQKNLPGEDYIARKLGEEAPDLIQAFGGMNKLRGLTKPGKKFDTRPTLRKPAPKGTLTVEKAPQEEIQQPIKQAVKITERLPSGLTKPRVMQAEAPERGIITPERQRMSLEKLNKEAAGLARSSIYKHLPSAQKIEEGHDFDSDFREGFKALEEPMVKANPIIDTRPIDEYYAKVKEEFKGIPKNKLPEDAQKILKEIETWQKRPQVSGKNLYRIYRFNNEKSGNIIEKKLLHGRQQRLLNFYQGENEAIFNSFKKTLPEDSIWMQNFSKGNQEYRNYQNARKTLKTLEGVLGGKPKPALLRQISENPRKQKELERNMGKEGAQEIIQISKDLLSATQAIKKIPARELSKWDAAYPLAALIPGLHIPGGIAMVKKGYDYARRGYGYYLTTPAKRHAYDEAMQAISENNLPKYIETTKEFK